MAILHARLARIPARALPKLHHRKCLRQQCLGGLHRTILELAIAKFGSARRARYPVISARTRRPDELATATPRAFDVEADHGSLPLRWDGCAVRGRDDSVYERSVNGEGRGPRTHKAAPAKLNGAERNISHFCRETLWRKLKFEEIIDARMRGRREAR
jgi:hypothetical protein